jgi:DNA-binding transcriptional MerR regulator
MSLRRYATLHPYHAIPALASILWCAIAILRGSFAIDLTLVVFAELIYQLFSPDLKFVREGAARLEQEKREKERLEAIDSAERSLRNFDMITKYRTMVDLENEIRGHIQNQPPEVQEILGEVLTKSSSILRSFLRVGRSLSDIRIFLDRTSEERMGLTLVDLENRRNDPATPEAVKAMIGKRILVLKTRLERVQHIKGLKPMLEAQLGALEEALALVRDQVLAPATPAKVRVDVDSILVSIEDNTAQEILDALHDVEDSVAEQQAYEDRLSLRIMKG